MELQPYYLAKGSKSQDKRWVPPALPGATILLLFPEQHRSGPRSLASLAGDVAM
jgi:hypothetical protein